VPVGIAVKLDESGRVGIGTASPGRRLDVNHDLGVGSGERFIASFTQTQGQNGLFFGYRANGSSVTSTLIRADNNLPITFGTSATNEAVTVTNAGYVGIGTTAPSAKLAVTGAGGITGVHINASGAADTPAVIYENSWLTGAKWLTAIGYDNQQTFLGTKPIGASHYSLALTYTGNVGVGTSSPQARFHSASSIDGTQAIFSAPQSANDQQILLKGGWNSNDATSGFAALGWKDTGSAGGAFWISTLQAGSAATGAPTKRFYIDHYGNVGIGTSNPSPSHKLSVNGSLRAKEVIVDTGWADYVFADDYRLAPLAEVEAHIKEKKHLPGIPSAREVAEQGVSVGEMQARLLAKLEELTLHVIRIEKDNAQLRQRVQVLETAR
jgi:hypothetical protein